MGQLGEKRCLRRTFENMSAKLCLAIFALFAATCAAKEAAQECASNKEVTLADQPESGCYIAIGDDVYDAPKWIGAHPGGPAAIKSRCGKELTVAQWEALKPAMHTMKTLNSETTDLPCLGQLAS